MSLVVVRHGGVPCAIEAVDAVGAEPAPSCPVLHLWEDRGGAEPIARWLRVQTARGDRSLPCATLRIVDAEGAARAAHFALPELLRDAIAAPWVTALTAIGDELVWLLDLAEVPR